MAILLNVWILPTGGASSGRVCACSLRSRLVPYVKIKDYATFCELLVRPTKHYSSVYNSYAKTALPRPVSSVFYRVVYIPGSPLGHPHLSSSITAQHRGGSAITNSTTS